jgi:hypothetical protein
MADLEQRSALAYRELSISEFRTQVSISELGQFVEWKLARETEGTVPLC